MRLAHTDTLLCPRCRNQDPDRFENLTVPMDNPPGYLLVGARCMICKAEIRFDQNTRS